MQSKLPDINAALVRYRSLAIDCYLNQNDDGAVMALRNIVALLPEDFKVVINTDEYNQKISDKHFFTCPKCKTQNPRETLNKYERLLSRDEQFAKMMRNPSQALTYHDKEYDHFWECFKCKTEHKRRETVVTTIKPSEPYYLGVIPEAPKRNFGSPLSDRMSFWPRFSAWFKIAFSEIESRIGIYRAEYIAQNPDTKDDFGSND